MQSNKTHALYACPSFSTVFGYLSMMYMFILGKSLLLLGMVKSEENAQLESTNPQKGRHSAASFVSATNWNAVSKVVQEWRIHQKWPYTLPEPNIAPARRPSLKGCYTFQPQWFRCYVSFRECSWFWSYTLSSSLNRRKRSPESDDRKGRGSWILLWEPFWGAILGFRMF